MMRILKIVILIIGLLAVLRFVAPTMLPKLFSYVFSASLSLGRPQLELLSIVIVVIVVLVVFRLFRVRKK